VAPPPPAPPRILRETSRKAERISRGRLRARGRSFSLKVGTRGFSGRFGGWNSLEDRDFSQHRLKAFMKLVF
jgi:hypothetical protein